jgi:hypothetical protein
MKKIALLQFFIVTPFLLYAQLDKRNWLVGGNTSFTRTKYNSEAGQKNLGYEFRVNPNIGYFVKEKLPVGLRFPIWSGGTKAQGTGKYSRYTDLNLGPFIRYYILSSDNPYNLVTEVCYLYGETIGNTQKSSKNTFSFSAGPVVYFTSSAGLELLVSYSKTHISNFAGDNNSIIFNLGFQFHLERD